MSAAAPPLVIARIELHPLAIPMRLRFEHAAASREVADPVLVRLVAGPPYADVDGWGETLARPYVTGETVATVLADLQGALLPHLLEFRAESFAEACAQAAALPTRSGDGRLITAARCAAELALLDLAGRAFGRSVSEAPATVGHLPPARSALNDARGSGIVLGKSQKKLTRVLRLQRCYGLRDFKIKVATDGWQARLEWTHQLLRRDLAAGRVTLRADANAGWTPDEAIAALPVLAACGVSALEQPCPPADDAELPRVAAAAAGIDLIADESLRTADEAERLVGSCGVRVLNVRLAKCGGLFPSLEIARRAAAHAADVQLGCLVGQTSLMTAAEYAFLANVPAARFVETAYAPVLLRRDLVRKTIWLRPGGRMRPLTTPGLGRTVDLGRVAAFAAFRPIVLNL